MKKVCIAFSIIFGILFAGMLALCLIGFLWRPVDLGEVILLAYEDVTGDFGHTVAGMWNKVAWISLWSSIGLFVLFSLNLVGAILIKAEVKKVPVEENTDPAVTIIPPQIDEPQGRRKQNKKDKGESKLRAFFKKIFKHKEKKVEEKVEEAVVEIKEEVKEEVVKPVITASDARINDFLNQHKKRH